MFETYWPEISAFFQVLLIDIVLAGDNAVVVGMAAAGVPQDIRRKVILVGIGAAVVLRILFAVLATQILSIIGLTLAGGVLLLWVCWKMYREIIGSREETQGEELAQNPDSAAPGASGGKTFFQAMLQILIADISMSLDNVLAVAGAAKDHTAVLIFGLLLSVALMGAAASLIAGLLVRHRWIAWVGLGLILYVSLDMIWRGAHEVLCVHGDPAVCHLGLSGYLRSLVFGH